MPAGSQWRSRLSPGFREPSNRGNSLALQPHIKVRLSITYSLFPYGHVSWSHAVAPPSGKGGNRHV